MKYNLLQKNNRCKTGISKKQNDLLSIKIADGDIDALLAIEDLEHLIKLKL